MSSSTPSEIAPVSSSQLTKPAEVVAHDENLVRCRRLEKFLKSVVNRAIFALKFSEGVPETTDKPNEHDSNVVIPIPVAENNVSNSVNIATQNPAKAAKKPKLIRSTLIGQQNVTFQLPKSSLVDNIDMDKLPSFDEENNLIVAPNRRHSYTERLIGWSVELRERDKTEKKGRQREKFFRHPHSTRLLRSANEIVRFILYEQYPSNRRSTKKDNKVVPKKDKGSGMTKKPRRKRKRASSSVDHRLDQQQITTNVVEKTHKDDNPIIAENVPERRMPKQVVNMHQSYNQQLAHAWENQMFANYHQNFYQAISSAKLPPGTKVTDKAFHEAKALAIMPLSIYKPNGHFANVTATPNRDMPIKAYAPATKRACMATSNADIGDKGKRKIDIITN